jgi:hydroxymethylglutaryl-CoA reductase
MDRARLPQFYRHTVAERLRLLVERGWLGTEDAAALTGHHPLLSVAAADKMVENVIGVFGLPLGLGLNFLIDGADYLVPMVVEEPSIIAALSSAAKLIRQGGGFVTQNEESLLIGQIQLVELSDVDAAEAALAAHRQDILAWANALHPNMVARGGGAREVQVRRQNLPDGGPPMLVVHLLVDTCDAMGANLVNTMCEGIAARVGELAGGRPFLRILSNLADRSLMQARCLVAPEHLATASRSGETVRDGIILANDFARVDAYRAATHNKGIMNGIDAVALATGNDWRAIEAGAHAWAGQNGAYTALTQWRRTSTGALEGTLQLPLKVGTVGGNLGANPAVKLAHAVLGRPNARQLAGVMAAVGLAQNFAALRALATDGIQQGHMALHARSVVASAGTPPELFDAVMQALLATGDIKLWRAEAILAEMRRKQVTTAQAPRQPRGARPAAPVAVPVPVPVPDNAAAGVGKVLLAGEHAVVYGSHALAVPIPLRTRADIMPSTQAGVHLRIPNWSVDTLLRRDSDADVLHRSVALILDRLGLAEQRFVLTVQPQVPRAMGLGGSAALAVAVVRALSAHFALHLTNEAVIDLAFEAEKVTHGHPSGVDNALATLGCPLLFKRGTPPTIKPVCVPCEVPLVLGLSHAASLTVKTVGQVRRAWQRSPKLYERVFADIDQIALQAATALQQGDLVCLGELMNINHGLLNALQVSTPELETLVALCRDNGAVGAKLTGGGGGGSVVAVCPDEPERCVQALEKAGFRALSTSIRPTAAAAVGIAS